MGHEIANVVVYLRVSGCVVVVVLKDLEREMGRWGVEWE